MMIAKSLRLPVLLLLVAAIFPFLPALLGGGQLGPTEHIQAMVGGPTPTYGWDVLQADGVLQFWPWRDLVFDAWQKGQMPLVNPYQLAGQPLAANSQSGAFYPLHVLFAFLPGPVPFKMLILGILHGFLAALGIFVWLRRMGVSATGASLAGVGFVMSQFMVSWAPLASVPTTAAWIPWALAGVLASSPLRKLAEVGLSVGMLLLAGHLQFAAYGLMAVLLSCIVGLRQDRRAWVGLAGVLLGVVVAWPQVSLVLTNSANSHRKNLPSEAGYAAYVAGGIKPYEALSIAHPRLLGDPSAPSEVLGDSGLPSAYWPMYVKVGSNPAECALWVSPVILALALVGVFGTLPGSSKKSNAQVIDSSSVTSPTRLASPLIPFVMTLLGLSLAFGTPINRLLFFYFPGWSATGSPGRSLVLIVLAVCALAGIGFDRLPDRADKRWFGLAAIPVLLLALGFNGMNFAAGSLGVENLDKIVSVCTRTHLPLVALTALVGAGMLALIIRQRSPLAVGLAVALPAAWLFPISGKPVELPKLDVPSQQRVAFPSRAWNIAKTPSASWPPNLASVARVHDLFGYDSILDGRFVNRLKGAILAEPAPPENGNMMLWRPKAGDLGRINALGAVAFPMPSGLSTPSGAERIIPEGTIIEDGYDRQIIETAKRGAEILIKDRYIDGMVSVTPGCEVSNKEGFRFVQCREGINRVELRYPGPSLWSIALALSAGAIGLTVILKRPR